MLVEKFQWRSDEFQGGRRNYFRMTEKGKTTYDRNKSNWEYAKRVLDNLL
jgi:PadR family transcriptional regulator PadR